VILTVTPNAALDITYEVDQLVAHQSHRVTAVRERAGGKGLNVASVLTRMGHPVIATGIVSGAVGDAVSPRGSWPAAAAPAVPSTSCRPSTATRRSSTSPARS
jgi:tagatose 6-phosphate kinase